MKLNLGSLAQGLVIPLLFSASAHANIVGAQFNASDGGVSDTIGGSPFYNLYLSTDNGATFINSGDGPSTAINISTAVNGLYTYQFYYSNSHADSLTLRLFLNGGTIGVSTTKDTSPTSFTSLSSGSNAVLDTATNNLVTLTGFSFSNGVGPALSTSVVAGAKYSPEIFGEFTYRVGTVSAVPEPGTYAMLLAGLAVMGGMVRTRRKDLKAS